MVKKGIALFLACLFLSGSVVLPLGDFSLVQDIPVMYHNYEKVTTPEELGIIDFIGDYLLNGKEIFGNNGHDKAQNPASGVQFQHQANPLNIVFSPLSVNLLAFAESIRQHPLYAKRFSTSGYQNQLFRPPFA